MDVTASSAATAGRTASGLCPSHAERCFLPPLRRDGCRSYLGTSRLESRCARMGMTTGAEVARLAEVMVLVDMGDRASTPSSLYDGLDRGVLQRLRSSCVFAVGEDALRLNKYDRGASMFEGGGPKSGTLLEVMGRTEAKGKPRLIT